jgi:hypothetical protein
MSLFRNTICAVAVGFTVLFSPHASASEASAEKFGNYAYTGKFELGITAFSEIVGQNPDDMEAKFALGALQFFSAVEGLQKSLYRYGAGNALAGQSRRSMLRNIMPIVRLPVPVNPNPEVASYAAVREILANFVTDLDRARTTLSTIGDRPVKLPIFPFRIATDLDHNGSISKQESILGAYLSMGRRAQAVPGGVRAEAAALQVVFDTADVSWLQGYTNVLMAAGKFFLAFNFEETYEASFHVVLGTEATRFGQFLQTMQPPKERIAVLLMEIKELEKKRDLIKVSDENRAKQRELRKQLGIAAQVKSKNAKRKEINRQVRALELTSEQRKKRSDLRTQIRTRQTELSSRSKSSYDEIFDAIAFIHTLNWQVVSPDNLADVRLHMLEVMRLNRVTWKSVMAESDNDHEWLPNAKQDGPFPNLKISQANIDDWLAVVDFAEGVLEGKKLIPHPRFTRGINLKKFFETAKAFDLVMFVAGPSAVPFFEAEGEIVNERTWRAITQPFNRNFGLFVVWFN